MDDTANFSPLSALLLLVLGYLIWSLPRRLAVSPLLVMVGIMPMGQQLDVAGLHFYLFRVLLLLGMARIYFKREFAQLKWTRIDRYFAWWVVVSVVFGSLSKPSVELLVNRLGDAFNAVGCYYFVRCVVVDLDDILLSVRTLAFVCLPVAGFMILEKLTGHNYLSVFGGLPANTMMREGSLRCQAAFRHPIMAGCFGATMFPIFVAFWRYRPENRMLAGVGAVASVIITITASSSGALIALAAGMFGLGVWLVRSKIRAIRWSVILAIILCGMVMNKPVWYLIAKASDLVGGGGWHRSYVIQTAVDHLDEWWLFGTTYTAHWGPGGEVIAADTNMMDITNHYIMEGVKGGLLKLVLFIVIVAGCFKIIGRRVQAETEDAGGGPAAFLYWALGVSLFAHCVAFISCTYFDQLIVIWYWLLATICCVGTLPLSSLAESDAAERIEEGEESSGGHPAYDLQN